MVMRERVTVAVLLVLGLVGAWYLLGLPESGPDAASMRRMALAAVAIGVLTSLAAGVVAATARGHRSDERDDRIALRSQTFRGFLYLSLGFVLLALAIKSGDMVLANGIFLAILGIEIVSGVVMLALYRLSA